MNAAHFLSYLRHSWPISCVDTDDELSGSDVVEWLGTLREQLDAQLSDPSSEEIRRAIAALSSTSFDAGEWDRNESDEPFCDVNARAVAAERYLLKLLGIPEDAPIDVPPLQTYLAAAYTSAELVQEATQHLRQARDLLKAAGAVKTLARVRAAIKSAGGAERHALCAPYREARKARR